MLSEEGILYRGEPEGEQRLTNLLRKKRQGRNNYKKTKEKGFELFRISL